MGIFVSRVRPVDRVKASCQKPVFRTPREAGLFVWGGGYEKGRTLYCFDIYGFGFGGPMVFVGICSR